MKENDIIKNEVWDFLLGENEKRRVYVASKQDNKGELLGVFSNRKILLGALQQVGIPDNAYIKGIRTNRPVSVSSVGTGFFNKALNIYYTDDDGNEILLFRVWEITHNRLNPKYIPKNDEDDND